MISIKPNQITEHALNHTGADDLWFHMATQGDILRFSTQTSDQISQIWIQALQTQIQASQTTIQASQTLKQAPQTSNQAS